MYLDFVFFFFSSSFLLKVCHRLHIMSYFNSQGLGSLNVCKRKKKLTERDVNIEMTCQIHNCWTAAAAEALQISLWLKGAIIELASPFLNIRTNKMLKVCLCRLLMSLFGQVHLKWSFEKGFASLLLLFFYHLCTYFAQVVLLSKSLLKLCVQCLSSQPVCPHDPNLFLDHS